MWVHGADAAVAEGLRFWEHGVAAVPLWNMRGGVQCIATPHCQHLQRPHKLVGGAVEVGAVGVVVHAHAPGGRALRPGAAKPVRAARRILANERHVYERTVEDVEVEPVKGGTQHDSVCPDAGDSGFRRCSA